MKIASIVGARPQFIKAAPVSRLLRHATRHTEVLVHTGQHYDDNMSAVFFEELEIPAPEYNLGIGSGSHGQQTGAMLAKIEEVLLAERPDWVLIYGDTNSTLAGALAAAKLHIPVAHVEAGLRSFNHSMPEEINRVLADHISSLLFCPSQTAVENLAAEGITGGVHRVGDVMMEALLFAAERAKGCRTILERHGLDEKEYLLATVHRPENTDEPNRLRNILTAFGEIDRPIIFPVHPRTRKAIQALDSFPGTDHCARGNAAAPSEFGKLKMISPVGYLDMIRLQQSARRILTDSGGIQKEAYWLGVPCITLRDETEWVETVQAGWNIIVGTDRARIVDAARSFAPPATRPHLYADEQTAARIAHLLQAC